MRPYTYDEACITKKHHPTGYRGYKSYKPWLRDDFAFRCPYCLLPETWSSRGDHDFAVDHFISQDLLPEAICDYVNLIYSCQKCNVYKGDGVCMVDPTSFGYGIHLYIYDTGRIKALTREGRELIEIFNLDNPRLTHFRMRVINLYKNGDKNHPLHKNWFGLPENIPDLSRLRPPANLKPEGVMVSFFQRGRKAGNLK